MNDITNLIEKYGPEISSQLKIASTQVYDKVLWYIRIDGARGIVVGAITFGLVFVMGRWGAQKIRWCIKNVNYSDGVIMWFLFAVFMIFAFFFIRTVAELTTMNIMKVVYPEYWIIDSIMERAR